MSGRRFHAPWSAEVTPNCFIVRDDSLPTFIMRVSRGDDQRPRCSAKMRREGLRRILRSCLSYCGRSSAGSLIFLTERPLADPYVRRDVTLSFCWNAS
jgi:hypothetical protein